MLVFVRVSGMIICWAPSWLINLFIESERATSLTIVADAAFFSSVSRSSIWDIELKEVEGESGLGDDRLSRLAQASLVRSILVVEAKENQPLPLHLLPR
ncbi:hypothetical protein PIB30_039474 [Stylosanthes scabra]|uniref:Secreted protein n=1 Tax=Stylosanthes scabra TaxID=79078 RepID=A0ABU6XBY5_9FABA|nr:hypothetical protein [Stylosanthes scabra]